MLEHEISEYLSQCVGRQMLPHTGMWTGFRCALFDMDGVLYDSMPNHGVAWVEAMRRHGIRFTVEDSYATEGMRGIDTIRIYAKRQLGLTLTEQQAQDIYDEKTRLFHDLPETQVFPGARELMGQCVAQGLRVCIVTGSGQRPLIHRLLTDFGEYIDEQHIVTAYDVEHGKPAPDPYLKGMHRCGDCKPWQSIVVENAPMGIRAGVASGAFTIAVNSGPLPDAALLAEGAHALVHSLQELIHN